MLDYIRDFIDRKKGTGAVVVALGGVLAVAVVIGGLVFGFRAVRMSAMKSKAPVIRTARISNGSTYLAWEAVPGASHYEVLAYDNDTDELISKKNVGNTDSAQEAADYSNASYSVRPFFGNEPGTDSEKVQVQAEIPQIKSCDIKVGDFNEINLSWKLSDNLSASSGVVYNIYRKEGDKSDKLLEEGFHGDTYIDESAKCGKRYSYTIEVSSEFEDEVLSGEPFMTGAVSVPDKKANISQLSNTSYGVSGQIEKVDGADCYKIFKKSGKKWKELAVIGGTEFVDVNAVGSLKYRAIAGKDYDGSIVWGKKGGDVKDIQAADIVVTAESQDEESNRSSANPSGGTSAAALPSTVPAAQAPAASVPDTPATDSEGRHPLMGQNGVTVDQMVSYFNSIGASYPAVYASKGAPTIKDFCQILYNVCAKYGIRDELVFAQVCLETGNLGFRGSSVAPEQCNFSGLGATGGGVSGNSFASVEEGLTAQVQHLRLYADPTYAAGSDSVDKRYDKSLAGNAPYVEWLEVGKNPNGGGWAVGDGYASNILAIAEKVKAR